MPKSFTNTNDTILFYILFLFLCQKKNKLPIGFNDHQLFMCGCRWSVARHYILIYIHILFFQWQCKYPIATFYILVLFIWTCFHVGHCVICSSSIYGFRLPLWYLQTLRTPHRLILEFKTTIINWEDLTHQLRDENTYFL